MTHPSHMSYRQIYTCIPAHMRDASHVLIQIYICTSVCDIHIFICTFEVCVTHCHTDIYIYTCVTCEGCVIRVSFAKEPYKRDYILCHTDIYIYTCVTCEGCVTNFDTEIHMYICMCETRVTHFHTEYSLFYRALLQKRLYKRDYILYVRDACHTL